MHRCLSQLVVPDSRMNGASLRYWEAQYDILSFPDMMNSPHGWSAWRIYGLRNLYLLTGEYSYLQQMVNAIGTCIQTLRSANRPAELGLCVRSVHPRRRVRAGFLASGKGTLHRTRHRRAVHTHDKPLVPHGTRPVGYGLLGL